MELKNKLKQQNSSTEGTITERSQVSRTKKAFIFISLSFVSASVSTASVIRTVTLDGTQYSCRPSSIEPVCDIKTDLNFLLGLAADSADAFLCLNDVEGNQSKIKKCFLQKRIRKYAVDLDIQMVGRTCWAEFLAKCTENSACPTREEPQKRCGHLGNFLNSVRYSGLSHLFNDNDGITMCQSHIE